jgi:hypothetical protein
MDRRLVVAVLLGSALVVNPLWLVPHADEPRHVYRTSATTTSDVRAAESVLLCDATPPPPCELERRAVTEGVAVGASPAAFDDRPAFVYLRSRDRYYRTRVRWVDGARTATGVVVGADTVRAAIAREGPSAFEPPADDVVADTLANGVARSRTRVVLDDANPDGPVVVEHEREHLTVRRTGRVRALPFTTPVVVWLLRAVLAAVGVGVLMAGFCRREGESRCVSRQ